MFAKTITLILLVSFALAGVFDYGVSSFDPTSDSIILWTRAETTEPVTLQLSANSDFALIEQQIAGIIPNATRDYTLHVPISNLTRAGETYYYRFQTTTVASPVGNFKLAPLATAATSFKFVLSGDSDGAKNPNGEHAYKNNFDVLTAANSEIPDFFAYIGDTVYADSTWIYSDVADTTVELWARYKENRQYPALSELLRQTATMATWDDHEVTENWYNLAMVAMGKEAFLNYFDIGNTTGTTLMSPTCVVEPFYRMIHYGSDVDIFILDTRACRSYDQDAAITTACEFMDGIKHPYPLANDAQKSVLLPDAVTIVQAVAQLQVKNEQVTPECIALLTNPNRTMLGLAQKQRFFADIKASTAKFKLVMSQVVIQELLLDPYDRWEGFPVERREVLSFIRDNSITGVIFLSTDMHVNIYNNVYVDMNDTIPVASEWTIGPIAAPTPIGFVNFLIGDLLTAIVRGEMYDYAKLLFTQVKSKPLCRNIDSYSYALIEYNAVNKTLSIAAKDKDKNILSDDETPDIKCSNLYL